MSWTTEISMRNNRDEDILCVIPQGLVFENKNVGSQVQNVAASREYRLIIPAESKMTVEIQVDCINRAFSAPNGQAGSVTVFVIDQPFSDQDELWRIMGAPVV